MIDFNSKIKNYDLRINEEGNFHCRLILDSITEATMLTIICRNNGFDTSQFSYPDTIYVHFVCNDPKVMVKFINVATSFYNQPEIENDLNKKLEDLSKKLNEDIETTLYNEVERLEKMLMELIINDENDPVYNFLTTFQVGDSAPITHQLTLETNQNSKVNNVKPMGSRASELGSSGFKKT